MNHGPENTQWGKGDTHPASGQQGSAREGDPELEAALRQALQPVAPPLGFADRVLARALAGDQPAGVVPVGSPRDRKLLHWPQSRIWITGAIAAGLLAGVFEGGLAYRHVREQQRRIVEATHQFQTTERITVRALAQAREQLQRAGVPLTLD